MEPSDPVPVGLDHLVNLGPRLWVEVFVRNVRQLHTDHGEAVGTAVSTLGDHVCHRLDLL